MFDLFWKVEGERNMSAFAFEFRGISNLSVIWRCSEATLFHVIHTFAAKMHQKPQVRASANTQSHLQLQKLAFAVQNGSTTQLLFFVAGNQTCE